MTLHKPELIGPPGTTGPRGLPGPRGSGGARGLPGSAGSQGRPPTKEEIAQAVADHLEAHPIQTGGGGGLKGKFWILPLLFSMVTK